MPATTDQLHTLAMGAEHDLEQLATGIAGLGAQDTAVKAITDMAHACRQIAMGLAKGPAAPAAPPTMNAAMDAHFAQRNAAAQAPGQIPA